LVSHLGEELCRGLREHGRGDPNRDSGSRGARLDSRRRGLRTSPGVSSAVADTYDVDSPSTDRLRSSQVEYLAACRALGRSGIISAEQDGSLSFTPFKEETVHG